MTQPSEPIDQSRPVKRGPAELVPWSYRVINQTPSAAIGQNITALLASR
jgi:hypothetical protein